MILTALFALFLGGYLLALRHLERKWVQRPPPAGERTRTRIGLFAAGAIGLLIVYPPIDTWIEKGLAKRRADAAATADNQRFSDQRAQIESALRAALAVGDGQSAKAAIMRTPAATSEGYRALKREYESGMVRIRDAAREKSLVAQTQAGGQSVAARLRLTAQLVKLRPDNPEYARQHAIAKRAADAEAATRARAEKARKKREGVRLGMSMQDVLDSSWGKPTSINRTATRWGEHAQWVYDNGNYLYFDNGILTSIQN